LRPTVYGQAPSAGKVLGANDRINIGFIGVGGQGMNAHVNISSKGAAANNISQVAVCDVWTKRTAHAKAFIEKGGHGDERRGVWRLPRTARPEGY
jgi:hypothetical protein